MSTRLMILGLLHEGPYHGYEIKQIMKDRYMDEWANVAFGSIYFALKQMTAEGLLIPKGTEKDGNRPSRTIFAITEEGRREFIKLLREGWQADPWPAELMRACLIFIEALPPQEIETHLEQRIEFLSQKAEHIEAVGQELSNNEAPWVAEYIWRYDIALCRRTQDTLQGLLEDIQTKRVDWSPHSDSQRG